MITTLSTDPSQRFGPVPAIGQDIELTRDRQYKGSDDLLSQGDFGLKWTATPSTFWMIELGPQGQKNIEEHRGVRPQHETRGRMTGRGRSGEAVKD